MNIVYECNQLRFNLVFINKTKLKQILSKVDNIVNPILQNFFLVQIFYNKLFSLYLIFKICNIIFKLFRLSKRNLEC